MSRAFAYNFTTLRISQAFISLQCRSESDKMISLAWIGDFEIRMHAATQTGPEKPLFILDMLDHDSQRLIDSRACYTLADGASAFDDFLVMTAPVVNGPP